MKRKEFMRTLKVSSMVVVLATSMILGGCSNSKNNENTSNAETAVESEESTPKADSTEDCKELENIENVMPAGAVVSSLQVNSLTETGDVVSENTDESSGSTSSNSGSSSSSGSSSGSSSSSSSGSGSSSSSSSSSSATTHTHNWTPVYRTVHHDAVTHTEDQGHYEDRGYSVSRYKCSTCGQKFDSLEELQAHRNVSRETYPDNPDMWHGGSSTINEWVSNNVWVSNIVTVTDSPAWDEQVLDHYECSCGATK